MINSKTMSKNLKYKFCEIQFHDNYMIAIIKEGEHLNQRKTHLIEEAAKTNYKNKPFVYITHRKNSYSVDPVVYESASKISNLKGFAVVAEVILSKGNAEIERMFFKKPFEIFDTVEDAIVWAKSLV